MRTGVVIGAVLLVVAVALAFPRSAEVAGVIGGPDRFATPVDVAADLQGRVFVAEREPCRLLRIDRWYQPLASSTIIESSTCASRVFAEQRSFGGALITQSSAHRLARAELHDLRWFALVLSPDVVAAAVWPLSSLDLKVIDQTKPELYSFEDGGSFKESLGLRLAGPIDIAGSADWVAILDAAGRRVHLVETRPPRRERVLDLPHELPSARRLAMTSLGHIFLIADQSSDIAVLDFAGALVARLRGPDLDLVRPVALAASGRLVFVLDGERQRIVVLSDAGSIASRLIAEWVYGLTP